MKQPGSSKGWLLSLASPAQAAEHLGRDHGGNLSMIGVNHGVNHAWVNDKYIEILYIDQSTG